LFTQDLITIPVMNTFDQMIERGHERVCFHHDPDTGLRAIVAIHSTKLGNGLGGVRRWHYATEADALYDVLRLSEGMTYKAAISDLPMGGGKSVVMLPKAGHPATEAEGRAMGRFVDTFHGRYIAAEDVGTDEQFVDWMATETRHVMGADSPGSGGDPSPFTARGVVHAMRAALAHRGKPTSFDGLTVAIQGVGNVGYHLASMLRAQGARVIGADISKERMERAADELGVEPVAPEEILFTDCEILAPCALGGVVDGNSARKLRCRIIAGAANNILDDPQEDAVILRNLGVLYAVDFVANAGGLIHLTCHYMGLHTEERDAKVAAIEETMAQVFGEAKSAPSSYAAAVALANRRIAEGSTAPKERVHAR
jgi:leucine dehydrogenase